MPKAYSEYEQKIARASKAWRHYEWVCSDDFAQHEEDRHVLIADGDYTGRPPVPLQIQKNRALEEYKDALENLRSYENKKHKKHLHEEKVKTFTEEKTPNRGRKRGGRALALQKYIRRIQRQIDETKDAPESEFKPNEGRGRPKMTKAQKVRHFERLIEKAEAELSDVYSEMDGKERIWHQLHDIKTDKRQLRLALKDPENSQSKRIWDAYGTTEKIKEELNDVSARIAHKEAQISMLDAGITLPKNAEDIDPEGPESLEHYRRALGHMIKEQRKIQKLELEAKRLGIDVEKLKRLM